MCVLMQVSLSGAIQGNNATGTGGGVYFTDSAQLTIDAGSTDISHNVAGQYGGGVAALSAGFDPAAVTSVTHNNTARYDNDATTQTTTLTLLNDSVVMDFVSRPAVEEGALFVQVNVSGFYGLPNQGMIVSALSEDGQPLAFNTSNSRGIADMLLRIRKPPGQYVLSFVLPDNSDVSAVNLTLYVRKCVKGESTPTVDTCQVCLTGFYSLDPTQPVCQSCPIDATCPGGAAIVPGLGYWHSAADSAQVHR